MQIKRFEANTMPDALGLIKKEFGDNAVILSARTLEKEKGILGALRKARVEVTAAIDTPQYSGSIKSNSPNKALPVQGDKGGPSGLKFITRRSERIRSVGEKGKYTSNYAGLTGIGKRVSRGNVGGLASFRHRMMDQGVEEDVLLEMTAGIEKIRPSVNMLNDEELRPFLIHAFEKSGIEANAIEFKGVTRKVVAFIGPTGVGKTTTLAKIAAIQALQMKRRVALVTLDNFRIAATEQLRIYARIIGVPLEIVKRAGELRNVLKRLKDRHLVLIDTAGMSQRDEHRIGEVKASLERISPVEIHLLLNSVSKEGDLREMVEKFKVIPIDRLIFTKLDESTKYGTLINQLVRTKIPVSYLTNGQEVPDDIEVASLEKLADLVMGSTNEKNFRAGGPEPAGMDFRRLEHATSYSGGGFIANKNSDVFHSPYCKWAKMIKTENVIILGSVEDARKNSLKPCRLCNPHVETFLGAEDTKRKVSNQ